MQYWLCAILALPLAGCGLVDSDVTNFDISLPQKTLSVDSAQWQLSGGGTFPDISCSSDATVCAAMGSDLCSSDDCTASCDGTSCQLTIAIGLFKDFNLQTENPSLQELDDRALISVSISRIFYEVTANTLTIETPAMDVYIAPMTVMNPGDPAAEKVGTIPVVPAQTTVVEGEMTIDAQGEEVLERFLEDWTTPFNIIVAAEVVISAGDDLPTGKLDAAVRVNASAGLN